MDGRTGAPLDLWHQILELAIHTPSPHNVQPWKFSLKNTTEAVLFVDRRRLLPKEDLTGSFVISAMGMMLEALAILAANRGYALKSDIVLRAEAWADSAIVLIPFANLQLQPDGAAPTYSDAVFLKRRTSRLSYEPKQITATDLDRLGKFVENHGQRFGSTSDASRIETMIGWNIDAIFHDLNDPDYGGEISGYFRCSDDQSIRLRDGLDYRCMNMSRSELWISGHAPFLLTIPGAQPVFKAMYRKRLGQVPHIGWISGPFWIPEQSVGTGAFLLRFWLELTQAGLYFHPFGNLVTNQAAAQNVARETGDDQIWLVFKLGYSAEPPQSRRLSVREVLT